MPEKGRLYVVRNAEVQICSGTGRVVFGVVVNARMYGHKAYARISVRNNQVP